MEDYKIDNAYMVGPVNPLYHISEQRHRLISLKKDTKKDSERDEERAKEEGKGNLVDLIA